jgi:error-prone DNA polymerase
VRPVDVQISQWLCTVEHGDNGEHTLRLGLLYGKGLRQEVGEALVESRTKYGLFHSAEDLTRRVPQLQRKELTLLARIGALNGLDSIDHRRDAVWAVEEAVRPVGPLLKQHDHGGSSSSPLRKMTTEERLNADYSGTGLTVGKHPLHYRRQELQAMKVLSSAELRNLKDGEYVRAAGCVIARQRPGTAKGFIFISMEDETGIANVIITPDLYERERLVVTRSKFVVVEGPLQNQDKVIHIKARHIQPLDFNLEIRSHDFH